MYRIIGAVIAIFLILITFIRKFAGECNFIGGATESENEYKNITDINQSDMKKVIDGFTANMDPQTKKVYAKLFEKVYLSKDKSPVVTLDDIGYELPYQSKIGIMKPSAHIGQRKLFLSELQFLTDVVSPSEQITVVYAGAAPSNHTGFLSRLFPNVKWLLVDPNPFEIFEAQPVYLHRRGDSDIDQSRARELVKQAIDGDQLIYIINDIFTMNIANAVAELIPRVYFISDIRTNMYNKAKTPDTVDILWNLSQQYNWMCTMKPVSSMLKFRHPFYSDDPEEFRRESKKEPYKTDFELSRENGIDFVKNFETRKLVYWDGTINLQAWAGTSSTESRLVTSANALKNYGTPAEYENKFYYYNSIERCYGLHVNENADRKLGFDHCGDCSLENHLWKNYLTKYKEFVQLDRLDTVKSFVTKLSAITHRHLARDGHGYFFERRSLRDLFSAIEHYRRYSGEIKVKYLGGPNITIRRK